MAVRARFWAETEEPFYRLLQDAADKLIAADDKVEDMNVGLAEAIATQWLAILRRTALAIFDETVPIDAADSAKIPDLIEGRKFLSMSFQGYGKSGAALYGALGIAVPDKKPKKGSKAA